VTWRFGIGGSNLAPSGAESATNRAAVGEIVLRDRQAGLDPAGFDIMIIHKEAIAARAACNDRKREPSWLSVPMGSCWSQPSKLQRAWQRGRSGDFRGWLGGQLQFEFVQ
jgi:hypothetical protein